jgi:L-threonylcarbamoyladenylate synthase
MPTETVYGLAGLGTDVEAIAAIFAAKQRPAFDPLILHVARPAMVAEIAEVSDLAAELMQAFWPGPLTLVLPRLPAVPDLVCNNLPMVGVRCPQHPLALELLNAVGAPLAAPSANRFGATSPTSAAAVRPQLARPDIPILDGGPCRVGVESTVLRLLPEPLILRPGGVSAEDLSQVLGRPIAVADDPTRAVAIDAPGRLPAHYAPPVPVHLFDDLSQAPEEMSRLYWRAPAVAPHLGAGAQFAALTEEGDPLQGAARLFALLLELAALGRPIAAELVPDAGLGCAINDRLRRAAASASASRDVSP